MVPSVRALGLAVVVAATFTAVLASPLRAADASLALAQRYAPVVRLVEQKEPCKHGEAYHPTDVNLVLGNPEVALRGPWDRTNIIKVATAEDGDRRLQDQRLQRLAHGIREQRVLGMTDDRRKGAVIV